MTTEGFYCLVDGVYWGSRLFWFAKGAIPAGQFAVVSGGYVTPVSTWRDGSLRSAKVLAQYTISGGYGAVTATLSSSAGPAAPTGTAPTISVAVAFDAGGAASCNVTALSNAVGSDTILKIRREDLTFFTSTAGFFVLRVENTTIKQTGGGDRSATFTPTINGAARAPVHLALFERFARTMGIYFFGMTDPGMIPAVNQPALEAAGFPPYRATPSEGLLASLPLSFPEDSAGEGPADMGTTGPVDSIGIMPKSSVLAITSNDKRAIRYALASAESLGNRGEIFRDENTGFPIMVSDWPYLSENSSDHGDYPISMGGSPRAWFWEVAHHPMLSALAYALTGLLHHYEGIVFVTMKCYLRCTDAGRHSGDGFMRAEGGQLQYRGWGWWNRDMAFALGLAPDGYHNLADLTAWLERNLAMQKARVIDGTFDESLLQYSPGPQQNTLGLFCFTQANAENPAYLYLAIWQHWFAMSGIGMMRQMDLNLSSTGRANMVAVSDHGYKAVVGMSGPANSTTDCDYRRADQYGFPVQRVADASAITSWKDGQNLYESANGLSPLPGTDDFLIRGHYNDYPIDSGQGWYYSYMGNMTPALTYAAMHNAPGAAGSYSRVFGSDTYAARGGDGNDFPNYKVLLDALPPTPAPTPAPTGTTPAPTPAPTGTTPAPTPAPTGTTPAPTPAPTSAPGTVTGVAFRTSSVVVLNNGLVVPLP